MQMDGNIIQSLIASVEDDVAIKKETPVADAVGAEYG